MSALGSSNRLIYDECDYQQRLDESTSPFAYRMYQGSVENSNKCIYDKFWMKYQLVNIESNLRNQDRPVSKCNQFKYSPGCKDTTGVCIGTFDENVPVIPAQEVCPVVCNNIPRRTDTGFRMPQNKF